MTKQLNAQAQKTPITRVLASVSFFAFLSRHIRSTKTVNPVAQS
jgi:hypothetical protein